MFGHPFGPRRHWTRHTALVPKGFLRYQVLELLSEKPMSGSEIMSEVQNRTGGCWRPSPGSIYPLLTWLQDDGYIKEMPPEENGMKRYTLTDKGKTLLEEEKKIRLQIGKKGLFLGAPFFGGFGHGILPWLQVPPERKAEFHESMQRLMAAFFEFGNNFREGLSKQALDEMLKLLNETASKLEEINRKLKEK